MRLRGLIVAVMLAAFLGVTSTASAAPRVEHPSKQAPAWFTKKFKKKVDRAGKRGKPKDEPSILDVCPGVHPHNGAVGTGTCLVYPYGCTANFVYYNGAGPAAPRVADGSLYLGTAGHCVDHAGQPV